MPLVVFHGIEDQNVDDIQPKLLNAVAQIEGVTAAAYSNLVPFIQLNQTTDIGTTADSGTSQNPGQRHCHQ